MQLWGAVQWGWLFHDMPLHERMLRLIESNGQVSRHATLFIWLTCEHASSSNRMFALRTWNAFHINLEIGFDNMNNELRY